MHFHAHSGKIGHFIKWSVVVAGAVPSYRHAVAQVLTRAFDRQIHCESAASFTDCTAIVAARPVDLVLLDMGLLKSRGLSAIGRLRDSSRNTAILLVAGLCDPETIRIVLMQGAAGYLPKAASPATLIGAVRAVLEGGRYVPDEGACEVPEILARPSAPNGHAVA